MTAATEKPITKEISSNGACPAAPTAPQDATAVLKALDLPAHMTTNALLEFINAVGTRQQLEEVLKSFPQGGLTDGI